MKHSQRKKTKTKVKAEIKKEYMTEAGKRA
jgi:hypothetical protein